MTTPWPRRWSASTRPSSSVGGGPGGPSTRSSWGPPSWWTGGTSAGFTAPSTTCRRSSTSAGGGSRRKARLPDVFLRPAPPSRRLGGELTSADTALRRRCSGVLHVAVTAAQRHQLKRLYRFLYHRQREATAAAHIQAAKSPENSGRFRPLSRARPAGRRPTLASGRPARPARRPTGRPVAPRP